MKRSGNAGRTELARVIYGAASGLGCNDFTPDDALAIAGAVIDNFATSGASDV